MKERTKVAAEISGELVSRMLEDAKLTPLTIAMRLGTTRGHVEKLLSGEKIAGFAEFIDLMEVLGKDPAEALFEFRKHYKARMTEAGFCPKTAP